jgi:hypothetical protein
MWAKSACLTTVVFYRRTFAALDYTVTTFHGTQLGQYSLNDLHSGLVNLCLT